MKNTGKYNIIPWLKANHYFNQRSVFLIPIRSSLHKYDKRLNGGLYLASSDEFLVTLRSLSYLFPQYNKDENYEGVKKRVSNIHACMHIPLLKHYITTL